MATEETFNPAAFARSESLSNINGGPVKSASISAPKHAKTTTNYPRIDLEPIYSDLKDSIGHQWDVYFDAVARFIRGDLHAREFGDLTDELLYSSDHTLHLHNKFITAILFNISRDAPDSGVAAWVTAASDKTASSSTKPTTIASDASEQRLKKEVMAMSARDRRRLKTSSTTATTTDTDDNLAKTKTQYEESYAASRIRVPEAPSTAQAGSLTKTNVELEIKKRYQLPLFVESAEFPDAANVYNRMVPICYEESIPQGSTMQCAELAVTAAEFYLKDFLSTVFDRVRANGPRYEYGNGYGGGVFTSKFKKQVAREVQLEQAKRLVRNKDDDMLPIESLVAKERRPLTVADFQLADRTGPKLWNGYPLIAFEVANRATENDFEEWRVERDEEKEDVMVLDGGDADDYNWDEDGFGGRGELAGLIDDCLVMT